MSNILKAILIDDEKDAIDSLTKILTDFIEGVEIIGSAQTIKEGLSLIENTTFDLLFLDVNMRNGTGFDLLEQAGPINANIIFVTAFDHYAIKAFKYSASDYLMKPVDIQELRTTIERIKGSNESDQFKDDRLKLLKTAQMESLPKQLALPCMNGYEIVEIKEIVRLEGQNNYTTIHLSDSRKIVVSKTLKEYESILTDHNFCRIFQSHLINIRKVKKYIKGRGGTIILQDDTQLPVSRDKKDLLLQMLKVKY